jgi:hypothetical protein
MRVVTTLTVLCAAACLPLACHLISGVGDLQFVDTVSGHGGEGAWGMGGTGGTGLSTTSSSSSTSQGGSGAGATGGGGATGGQGGVPAPALPCTDLHDGFEGGSLDTIVWNEHITAVTPSVTNGYYAIVPDPGPIQFWGSLTTNRAYDLRGCSVVVEVLQALNNDVDCSTSFSISDGGHDNSVGFRIYGGQLVSQHRVGGTSTELAWASYEPSQPLWLQLREEGGTLHFESSPDGVVGNWAEQVQEAPPSFINYAYVGLSASDWSGTSTNPGEAHFDNVNLPP